MTKPVVVIVRKEQIEEYIKEFDDHMEKLRNVIQGKPPNENEAHIYDCPTKLFLRNYTTLDSSDIEAAIERLSGILKGLKKMPATLKNKGRARGCDKSDFTAYHDDDKKDKKHEVEVIRDILKGDDSK